MDGHEDVAEELARMEDPGLLDDVAVDERVVELDRAGAAEESGASARLQMIQHPKAHQPTLPRQRTDRKSVV